MISADVCAVILAGGQSRRMGFNKALVDIGGQPLIQVLIDRIRPLTEHIFISTNDLFSYTFLDFPVIADEFRGHGPLAGLHAVMLKSQHSLFLLLACDLPNLNVDLLRNLLILAEGFDAVIPRTRDDMIHPLCAVYRRTCLPVVDRNLRRGSNRFMDIFLDVALTIKWVMPDEGKFKDSDLANLNTPEDLHRLKL